MRRLRERATVPRMGACHGVPGQEHAECAEDVGEVSVFAEENAFGEKETTVAPETDIRSGDIAQDAIEQPEVSVPGRKPSSKASKDRFDTETSPSSSTASSSAKVARQSREGSGSSPSSSSGSHSAPVIVPAEPSSPPKPDLIWVSVDPRSGEISVYPGDVAIRVEEAFQQGKPNVSLSGLGGYYEKATIAFERTKTGRPEQITPTGRRDVRRVEVPGGTDEVSLHVAKESKWRAAEEEVPGCTVKKSAKLVGIERIKPGQVSGTRTFGEDPTKEARAAAVEHSDKLGLVGLWEWCRSTDTHIDENDPSIWGLYLESQNEDIETAFRAGRQTSKVVIGIRTFEICFDGPSSAKQVDHLMKKKRRVRRRLMSENDRAAIFVEAAKQASNNVPTGGDDECAICFATFEETPMMPTVRLKECGHIFHCPCIQHIADKKGQCPLCRKDIKWTSAMGA
eukprot:TRINITY_DN15081_c0_g1_i1.p1 TRINITY_DN15081_c0_g1~~TRINITY_DN15081_c0_g1_i1.p1  ORF type:complete len:453 (+),score=93.40 TRINITY_DN15081_c0_g1_i1:192-1550(+)